MLDDLNVMKQRDPQGFIGFAAQVPGHIAHDYGLSTKPLREQPFTSVVFAGMGGSALPAELLRTWPSLPVPFVVVKNYDLPEFVDANTLVIVDSYSGNTEESLEALGQAQKKGAYVAAIAYAGKLKTLAEEQGLTFASVPECPQPRTATFYMYRAVIEILVAAKLLDAGVLKELEAVVPALQAAVKQWAPEVPKADNQAKQLAEQLAGKTPIIYAGPNMSPAAYKWKISMNENAKNTAWTNTIPEISHNEFIGWSSHPVEKPFGVIDLVSSFEHPRVLRRFEVIDRLLSGMRPKAITVNAQGNSVLEHMLYLTLLGDFTSTYLSYLNGVNPTPVDLVEKLKKELG
jgi:glucose/mannose-6-phosphate isomerase